MRYDRRDRRFAPTDDEGSMIAARRRLVARTAIDDGRVTCEQPAV